MAPPEDSLPVAQYILVDGPDGPLIREIMRLLFRYIAIPDSAGIRRRIGSIRNVTAVHMIFYVSDTSLHVQSETRGSDSDDSISISDETV